MEEVVVSRIRHQLSLTIVQAVVGARGTSFANLGIIYSDLGEYDKALPAYQEDVRLNPGIGIKHGNLVSGYLQLNRLDEAKATARSADAHKVDSPEIHLNLYWIAFLQHDARSPAWN